MIGVELSGHTASGFNALACEWVDLDSKNFYEQKVDSSSVVQS